MKKIKLTLLVFFFFKTLLAGQFLTRHCDSLILDEHVQDVLNIQEITLREYLIKKKGVSPSWLSNRQNLRLLKTWVCTKEEVFVADTLRQKSITVHIKKARKPFDPSLYIWPDPPYPKANNLSMLLYDANKSPFGFLPQDTLVEYIDKVEITVENDKSIHLPVEALSDLYFPNFCYTLLSAKPIQIFLSPNQEQIFLYIFGEIRGDGLVPPTEAFLASYMAKIIIDLDKGYQSRIVLRGDELCYYNWNNCTDFIGF